MMGIEEVKGLELPFIPGRIGQRIRDKAETVQKEHPEEMERVYRLIRFVFDVEREEGRLALEEHIAKFDEFDAPFSDFLADYIMMYVDGIEEDLLAEMMANEFEVRRPDDFEAFVLYIYILAIPVLWIHNRFFIFVTENRRWRNGAECRINACSTCRKHTEILRAFLHGIVSKAKCNRYKLGDSK